MPVSTVAASIVTFTYESAGFSSSSWISPSTPAKRPFTVVIIICRTEKPTCECAVSNFQVVFCPVAVLISPPFCVDLCLVSKIVLSHLSVKPASAGHVAQSLFAWGLPRCTLERLSGKTEKGTGMGAEQELALKLYVVLTRANNAVQRHAEADMSRHDLSPGEFAIMEALYHKGPLLLGEVQRKILVSSGGVTYLVDRLEEQGLVVRQLCAEDRRARYAALTEQGKGFMTRIFPEHAECIAEVAGALTP